jgi:hypothetical protein
VGDHRSLVELAALVIEDRGIAVPTVAYPIGFTGCHDVDMRSLLPRVVAGLRGQVTAIDAIIASTGDDGVAAELAQESRASTLSHIGALEQVATSAT